MELIIVVVIIGVIAGFAIPSYQKTMVRQQVRKAFMNVHIIAGAQEIYKARNGRYWCDFMSLDCFDLNSINTNLKISIIPDNNIDYTTYAQTGSEDKFFTVAVGVVGDPFMLSADSPPLNIVCSNILMNVCP